MINRVAIAGRVVSQPLVRVTPAGIRITTFDIEHGSVQSQAGKDRQIKCRIPVFLAEREGQSDIRLGSKLTVHGFLTQRSQTDDRLVVQGQTVELNETD